MNTLLPAARRLALASLTLLLAPPVLASPAAARAKPSQSAKPDAACNWMRERIAQAYVAQHGHRHYTLQMVGGCPPSAPGGGPSFGGGSRYAEPDLAGGSVSGKGAALPSSPRLHFTGTNNRVAAMDEADVMKSNGRTLFALRGAALVVVRLHPAKMMRQLARIELPKHIQRRLLLAGDRLVIVEQESNTARLILFDVSKPARPLELARFEVEGRLVAERTLGGEAIVVLATSLRPPVDLLERRRSGQSTSTRLESLPAPVGRPRQLGQGGELITYGCCQDTAPLVQPIREKIRQKALAAMEDLDPDLALPILRRTVGKKSRERPLLHCDAVRDSPEATAPTSLLAVLRLDLKRGVVTSSSGLLDTAEQLYATPEALYLSHRVDTSTFNRSNSCSGVAQLDVGPVSQSTDTVIHAFELGKSPTSVSYAASGRIAGNLRDSFSIDAFEGYLRVALSTSAAVPDFRVARPDPAPSSNARLVILAPKDGRLEPVGSLENMAPGERIYAVRLLGPLGYVVTFPVPERPERIDPLFTLDLSNPAEPKVVGELKIPGFSNYLHPFGERRLVAIGQDADAEGRELGAHLQVFDLGNLKKPKRTSQIKIGGQSQAQLDHHAFLADPVHQLIAVPVQSPTGTGLRVFRLEGKKLVDLGQIDHSCQPGDPKACPYPGNAPPIDRAFVVEDHVYSLSRGELRAHRLVGLKETARLSLAP